MLVWKHLVCGQRSEGKGCWEGKRYSDEHSRGLQESRRRSDSLGTRCSASPWRGTLTTPGSFPGLQMGVLFWRSFFSFKHPRFVFSSPPKTEKKPRGWLRCIVYLTAVSSLFSASCGPHISNISTTFKWSLQNLLRSPDASEKMV